MLGGGARNPFVLGTTAGNIMLLGIDQIGRFLNSRDIAKMRQKVVFFAKMRQKVVLFF